MYRTVEGLRTLMQNMSGEKEIKDEELCWFVCRQHAASVSDMNNREIAELFRDGIKPVNTLEKVQEYLDIEYTDQEGNEPSSESWESLLISINVARFLGLDDKQAELEEKFEQVRKACRS